MRVFVLPSTLFFLIILINLGCSPSNESDSDSLLITLSTLDSKVGNADYLKSPYLTAGDARWRLVMAHGGGLGGRRPGGAPHLIEAFACTRALVVMGAVCWLGTGCTGRAPEGPPNVLLITLDTVRADHIGSYGFEAETTPFIDALAERSVVFERAIAASARTAPSHASILTSRWVRYHSIGHVNGTTRLLDEPTLAEQFAAAGYDTAAFVSNPLLARRIGLDRGFDVYDDELSVSARSGVVERDANATSERAEAWLGAGRDKPWFTWVHFQDPHGPYTPPPPFERVELRAFPDIVDD